MRLILFSIVIAALLTLASLIWLREKPEKNGDWVQKQPEKTRQISLDSAIASSPRLTPPNPEVLHTQQVDNDHGLMAEFQDLSKKALRSQHEEWRYRRLLSQRDWQQGLIQRLQVASGSAFSAETEKQRMRAISAISEVLGRTDDYQHRELLDEIEAIILDQSFRQMADQELQKSLIGDKIELLVLLYRRHQDRVDLIREHWADQGDEVSDYVLQTAQNLAQKNH